MICLRDEIVAHLLYRRKYEALQGASAADGGMSAAAAESEKDRCIRQFERSLGACPFPRSKGCGVWEEFPLWLSAASHLAPIEEF